jgi:hypothetical protein
MGSNTRDGIRRNHAVIVDARFLSTVTEKGFATSSAESNAERHFRKSSADILLLVKFVMFVEGNLNYYADMGSTVPRPADSGHIVCAIVFLDSRHCRHLAATSDGATGQIEENFEEP